MSVGDKAFEKVKASGKRVPNSAKVARSKKAMSKTTDKAIVAKMHDESLVCILSKLIEKLDDIDRRVNSDSSSKKE